MFMGAYSIYYIFFTLATAGLPVALSRLVAEADANGRAKQEEKTFRVALVTFSLLGLVFASIMFFFPNWLAAVYLDDTGIVHVPRSLRRLYHRWYEIYPYSHPA